MKTFKEKIIFTFLFAVLASSSHLLAQNGKQTTDYRLQTTGSKTTELPLKNLIEQGAEITANNELPTSNCNNQGDDLDCHLMMNPAMVGETEEAIEKFIIGETEPP